MSTAGNITPTQQMPFGAALEGMLRGEFWETRLNVTGKGKYKSINSVLTIKNGQFVRFLYKPGKFFKEVGPIGYLSTWSLLQEWLRIEPGTERFIAKTTRRQEIEKELGLDDEE